MNTNQIQWVENASLVFSQTGMPLAWGKILAYLLISDDAHVEMKKVTEDLKVSKGGTSTGLRFLITAGLVEKIRVPDIKNDCYRIRDDAWMQHFKVVHEQIIRINNLAKEGVKIAQKNHSNRTRLEEMLKFHTWILENIPAVSPKK